MSQVNVLNGYRDSHDVSSDDDSDDSDKECTVWKRAPARRTDETSVLSPKVNIEEEVKQPPNRKRKANTIWSEVLEDQLISEDLEDCLLKNKPRHYGSRGKESYDYTLRYSDPRIERDSDCYMSDSAGEEEPPLKSKFIHSSSHRNENKKFVKLDSAELAAARKINKVLNEKKFYLIQRIVKTVGIDKAMNLLAMTQDVEENGGMMINNNRRRRTPGGVYIQLLKNDKDVTQEMINKIFEGEMTGIELKKYYAEKKKNLKERKKKFAKREESKKKSKMNVEIQDFNGMVPMDAEVDMTSEQSNLDNNPVPICGENNAERNSDLEEGEIED